MFGIGFVAGGIAFLSSSIVGGLSWIAIGGISIGIAFWVRRDLSSPDPEIELPGVLTRDQEAEVRLSGRDATAHIAAFRYLGVTVGSSTLVELSLDIDGVSETVGTRLYVSLSRTSALAVGRKVDVTYLPENPSHIIVNWGS